MRSYTGLRLFERIIGCSIEEAEDGAMRRIIGARESQTLEFKSRCYDYGTPTGKAELCKDVLAMANATGGVIVLGVCEDDGVASALDGAIIEEHFEQTTVQVLMGNCVPPPEEVQLVATQGATPCYVLLVPPSDRRPHGYQSPKDQQALRYPLRVGHETMWMSESQLADRYRGRFDTASRQVDRLEKITGSATAHLRTDEGRSWLIVSQVPNAPGQFSISRENVLKLEDWYRDLETVPFPHQWRDQYTASVSYRCVVVRHLNPLDPVRSTSLLCHFHSDGSSVVCLELTMPSGPSAVPQVHDDELAEAIVVAGQLVPA